MGGGIGRLSADMHRDAELIAPDLRAFDAALDRALDPVAAARARAASPDATLLGDLASNQSRDLADRVFAASRGALRSDDPSFVETASDLRSSGGFGLDVVRTLPSLPHQRRSGAGRMRLAPLRLARVALAAAAAIAVVAGSWIVIQQSGSPERGRSNEMAQLPIDAANGIDGHSNSSASSIAELTLVAMLDNRSIGRPVGARPANASGLMTNWVSADRLGDSDAARLAAPVLRTHGAAIDDIESELEAILGVDDANESAASSDALFGNAT